MRTTALLPSVAMRDVRAAWEELGKPDSHTRALAEASKILLNDNPAVFSPEMDAKISSRFKGLVTGDVCWPS